MQLNPKLKTFLIISAKSAVGAVVTNTALVSLFHSQFNFNNWAGIRSILLALGSTILGSEVKAWLPIIIKWYTSPTNGVTK